MDVAAWQRRLETTFNEANIVGPRLIEVRAAELSYDAEVRKRVRGYTILADSFQSFLVETLQATKAQYVQPDLTANMPYQPTYFLAQLTVFRSIRAAESLFYGGYPLDGLSLLRDVKDRAVFHAAWMSGLTSWRRLNGVAALPPREDRTPEAEVRFRRAREKEENRVLKLMLRADSDLPEDVKTEVKGWEDFFNTELHGSHFTSATEFGGWLRGQEPLSIAPLVRERSLPSYFNRAAEVFWMVLRTLPFLQLSPGGFGDSWAQRWSILDDSFRVNQLSLEELGKPVATAVRRMIELKFPFSPATGYVERDN